MRAPLISLLICAAGLAAGGCASGPPQNDAPVTSADHGCSGDASDPLHLTSNKTAAERGDPEIESILTQRAEPRLIWVNRQMYQSLHALDVELRREQRVAACERSRSGLQTLEAQAGGGSNGSAGAGASGTGTGAATSAGAAMGAPSGTGGGTLATGGAGGTGGGAVMPANGGGAPAGGTSNGTAVLASAGVTTTGAAATSSAGTNSTAAVAAMSAAPARSALMRKSSLSSAGGGGNGATMPKVVAGSDNDIVARRLRKAAEQETDPALRAKLWKEYADYRQGIAAK
jgi:hypothetical protein